MPELLKIILQQGYVLMDLMQFVCVLLIVFYVLFQGGILKKINTTDSFRAKLRENLLVIFLFGGLAIAATYLGSPIDSGDKASPIANVRNLAAMIAGMLGGPVAGIGAGLIGGIHRSFLPLLSEGLGSSTSLACMIVTLVAGVVGGVINVAYKKQFPKPLFSALVALALELFDMGVVYLLGTFPTPNGAWHTISSLFVPMMLANCVGMFIFTFMVNRALNYQYIKDTKDKIESELQTAHEIQASMLPRIFPAFPDRKEFDIHATMDPAKNVGGDFYDFFLIDKSHLCFIIGDVSDKGVPAALFMTIIKTLLKTEALHGSDPDAVLKHVNDILYPDNESCSFATVFCGILNVRTGDVTYSNGGHIPPYLMQQGKELETIPVDRNYMVGNLKDATFTTQKMKLKKGDILFLFTDGATDATSETGEMFSEKKLKSTVSRLCRKDLTGQDLIDGVTRDLRKWAGKAPQYDDTTMLALRYLGLPAKETSRKSLARTGAS